MFIYICIYAMYMDRNMLASESTHNGSFPFQFAALQIPKGIGFIDSESHISAGMVVRFRFLRDPTLNAPKYAQYLNQNDCLG